jgi:hypothetical protein
MDNEIPKSALLIYSKKNVSSFVDSGFLEEVNHFGTLNLIALGINPASNTSEKTCQVVITPLAKSFQKLSVFVRSLELWSNRHISYAHKIRAYNQFGTNKDRTKWLAVVTYNLHNWGSTKRFAVRLLSKQPMLRFLQVVERIFRNTYVKRKWAPALSGYTQALIPYAGYVSYEFNNLVWLCRKIGVKTLALQENWDNVSSNLVITEVPDKFAVWGTQSKYHLVNIHGLDETSIEVVGSPRFGSYYGEDNPTAIAESAITGIKDLTGTSYVLLIGTGDGIDDEELLQATHKAIKNLGTDVRIVYRPHPGSRYRGSLDAIKEKFPEVVIDEFSALRAYGHHIPLVRNARVVINHLSTLTLEGLIANRFVCVPLFLGRNAVIRYNRIIDSAPHYVGLKLLPNLLTPESEASFVDCLQFAFKEEPSDVGQSIEWVCKKTSYSEEIAKIIF